MGMVYVLSAISLAVVLFFIYWLLSLLGVPGQYSLAVVGFIVLAMIWTTLFSDLRKAGEIQAKGERPLRFEAVEKPDATFLRVSPQRQATSKVYEVIPANNFAIATEARVFDQEPLRTTVYQFKHDGQPDVFFANRRGDNHEKQAVIWFGELSAIEDASPLAIDDQLIQQVVKVNANRYVLAVNQARESWKYQVLVVDGAGRIVNSLYQGTDLEYRDRATEAWRYAGDKTADISVHRINSDEYLIPFSLGERGTALVIGTGSKNYDSFFSAQGFYLPTQSQVFWFEDQDSVGVHSASFPIAVGMPLAASRVGAAIYWQTIDPRDRENPSIHYYRLLNP